MKLEIGMYVRTDLGEIGKVTSIADDNFNEFGLNGQFYNSESFLKGNEIKASHNIIDLIEINDIVQIKENIDNYSKSYFIGIDEMATLRTMEERIENKNLILESILTREQFENNCYKIGD